MFPDKAAFVHPAALVESDEVGPGTRVWAFAHVMAGARIGADCNVCDHVFVESGAVVGDRVTLKNNVLVWNGVIIEDDVFVGPNAVFTNDPTPRAAVKKPPASFLPTVVRGGATIGANATVVCGVTVDRYAFVGAGAVVTRSVPAYALVAGNPANRIGWACECGVRLPDSLTCSECGRRYRRSGGEGLEPVPSPA
jgi:UDP-2-acetamido-3-amino-2,3-dideoxy-glucuronate N-acetyltransferase